MNVKEFVIVFYLLFLGAQNVYSMEVPKPSPEKLRHSAELHAVYIQVVKGFGERMGKSPEEMKQIRREEKRSEKRHSINRFSDTKHTEEDEDEEFIPESHALFDNLEFEGLE